MSWESLPLRRIFRVVNGGTPRSDPENWEGTIAWATPVDLGRRHGKRISATDRTLTPAGLSTGSRAVSSGSLLVSSRAPIGYIAQTTCLMAFNQGCKGLEPTQPVDVRFFRYQLSSMTEDLQSRGQGSTFLELSGEALAATRVTLPPLVEQRTIADYLDTETSRIDNLIRKKRRMIELLDKRLAYAARALTTANGAIGPLRRFVYAVKTGTTPPARKLSELLGSDIGWYSPGDVGPNLQMLPPVRSLNSRALSGGWTPIFPADSTLIVGIGATAGRVGHNDSLSTGNQQITCISPNAKVLPRFLSWQLWARSNELRETAPYTTLPILNNDFLRSTPIVVPSLKIQETVVSQLDRSADRLLATAKRLRAQIGLLTERRQSLITQAVVGKSLFR